jgi:hypothetical protein
LSCLKRFSTDLQSFSDFSEPITPLNNLRQSILLQRIGISSLFAESPRELVPE